MTRRVLACAVAVILATGIVAGRQTFKSGVDLVRVDVLVTHGGKVVTGLSAADFDLLDNGVVQKPEFVSDAEGVSVLPLLDISASVQGERLRHLLLATRALLHGLRPGDAAGLLTFNESISMVVPFAPVTPRAADITAALAGVEPAGSTALYDALYAGMTLAANDTGRSLLLLFSDGADTSSWLTQKAVDEAARRLNVVVYAVVVGHDVDLKFVRRIVDATGGQVFAAESNELEARFAKILEEFRQRFVLAYQPQGVPRGDGWHTIEVRLKSKPGTVKARPGYFAGSR